jgi:Interleukin-like EMT inducer
MLAFAFGDTIGGFDARGYIGINGIQWLTTWTTQYRGFNIVELNVSNCSPTNIYTFDTYASTSNSAAMVTYINSLRQPTVLIGVTADDVTHSLTAAATSTLEGIGVDLTNLVYQGKATFVTQIGNPSASVVKIGPAYGDNLMSTVAVRCTYKLNVMNIATRLQAVKLTARCRISFSNSNLFR